MDTFGRKKRLPITRLLVPFRKTYREVGDVPKAIKPTKNGAIFSSSQFLINHSRLIHFQILFKPRISFVQKRNSVECKTKFQGNLANSLKPKIPA